MRNIAKKSLLLFLVIAIVIGNMPISIMSAVESSITDSTNKTNNAICLTELERTSWDRYTGNQGDSKIEDLDGNNLRNGNVGIDGTEYHNGFEAWIARWNFKSEISWVSAIYNLDAKYEKLTGKTSLIPCYNKTNFDTTLSIYGNNVLLYSCVLTDEAYEFAFDINVKGIKELKIHIEDNIAVKGGTSFAIYDLFLHGQNIESSKEETPVIGEFNGHSYQCFDIGMKWDDAKEYCERMGGHLVVISSPEEQKMVENIISKGKKNFYWLGGYRDGQKWKTVTGELFDLYTNWKKDEPNNSASPDEENKLQIFRKNYGQYIFGEWNDLSNDAEWQNDYFGIDKCGFVCEWGTSVKENGENNDTTYQKSGSYGSNLTWTLDIEEGVLNILGKGTMEKLKESPWKDYYPNIKRIFIENGVANISERAFANCINVAEIIIPNSVKSIGRCAFESCFSLETITIPSSVEKIYTDSYSLHDSAFCHCNKLADIFYGGTQESWKAATNGKDYAPINVHFLKANNPSELFEYKEQISKLWKGGAAIITSYKGTEKNVTVPQEIDGYTIIGLESGSFTNCDWIESITLPATINKIEDNSLPSNGALTDVYFAESWITWNKVQLGYQTEQIFENKVKIHCETGVYTSATDRIITVGEKVIYLIYTNDPNDTVVSIQKSNEKTLKLLSTTDGNNLPDPLIENIIPAKNYCTVVVFEGVGNGIVDISFSVKAGGETTHFNDTVYCYDENLDEYNVFRAENIEDMKWEGDLFNDKNDVYCGWSNGIIISDFDYYKSKKNGESGYVFMLNAYNGKACNGACDVFDSEGRLIESICIDPYEIDSFEGIYTLGETIGNCFCKVWENGVSFKTTRTETLINVFVPEGGYIRITNDMSLSPMCALYNMIDIAFSVEDIANAFVIGMEDAPINIKDINAKNIKKLFKETVVEAAIDGVEENFTAGIEKVLQIYFQEGFSENTFIKICEMLSSFSIEFLSTKSGYATAAKNLADSISNTILDITKVGAAFDWYYLLADATDLAFTISDITKTIGTNKIFQIHTDVNIDEVKQILKNAGITIDTRENVDPEAILHTYKVLADDEMVIDLGDSGILNEYETYEISLIKDGYKVQPNDKVQVSIELSQDLKDKKNLTVLRENDDGTWEIIESRIENGMIVFEVDHFCRFVIGAIKNTIMSDDNTKEETIDNDDKSENAPENSPYHKIIIIAVMVVLVGVAVLVIVLIKNKRKRSEIN